MADTERSIAMRLRQKDLAHAEKCLAELDEKLVMLTAQRAALLAEIKRLREQDG